MFDNFFQSSIIISIQRTVVPMVVGFILAFLTKTGLEADDPTLVAALTTIFSALYYTGFRLLEEKFPKFGKFLGRETKVYYD